MTEYQAQDHPGRTAAAPPPGWYPDHAGVMRWWDGTGWGPQNPDPVLSPQPSAATVAASGARAPFPWAWTVAATPLILLGVAAATAALGGPAADAGTYLLIGDVAAAVIALIAAWRDVVALRRAGEVKSYAMTWWCLIPAWAYLLARAVQRRNRTGRDWAMFIASVTVWLIVIVVSIPVVNAVITSGTQLNQAKLQSAIAQWAESKVGSAVTVTCPTDPPANPGSVFDCVMTASDGSTATVAVTVQDRRGDVTWQVQQ